MAPASSIDRTLSISLIGNFQTVAAEGRLAKAI
jgi:hypothetical protein